MAATCGFFQNDRKRVIAYSTCSQLGYMMVSLGLSQYGLAIYHLMTHACFKALLFLSAGAVIHAVSDVQDVRRHGGFRPRMPRTYTAMTIGSFSLAGLPFLSGYYSKDAILEASWSHPTSVGSLAYRTRMSVAAFTSYYTFRLRWCSFRSSTSSRQTELPHSGLPLTMSIPLVVRSLGSLVIGYGRSDALIGVGTPFWNGAILPSPQTTERFAEHRMPSSVLLLPILATRTGLIRTAGWSWPMPWSTGSVPKLRYLFFRTRWQFDFVANTMVSRRVLDLGSKTWARIDKGVLELLGPRGRTAYVTSLASPKVRQRQSGIVHDYARNFKFRILFGFFRIWIAAGIPSVGPSIGINVSFLNFYDLRTITAITLWIRSFS